MTTSTNQVRTIRTDNPRYGLKTAALITYQHRITQEQHDTFTAARRDALAKERARVEAKLDSLRADIRKLIAKLEVGVVIDVDGSFAKLTRMGAVERKFECDISRITDKIGAIQ